MRAYDKVELALLYCPGRSAESALKNTDEMDQAMPAVDAGVGRHRI